MRRPTAIALLALFVALSGTAFAAVKLSKGQVKKRHIATSAVTGKKVKNGSLRARDFRAGELPAGPTGTQGAPGPQGKPFDVNATLPSGETLSGVFGVRGENPALAVSFRIPLAEPIAPGNAIYVLSEDDTPPADCPAPGQAAPGHLCLYETSGPNQNDGEFVNPRAGTDGGADPLGFYVYFGGTGGVYGTWSVTAP